MMSNQTQTITLAPKPEMVNGRERFFCEVNSKPNATRYYSSTPEGAIKIYREMFEGMGYTVEVL